MEVLQDSYKDTKIGKIPKDWEVYSLREIAMIGDGNHSAKYPRNSEFVNEGVPFIRSVNLANGKISSYDMKFITPQKHEQLKKGHLKTNDILFTNRGQIGKSAIVQEEYNNSNLNSQTAWIRCKEHSDFRFIFFQLNSAKFIGRILAKTNGTALQQLTIKDLKGLRLSLPPLPEQQKIAEILSTVDEQISATERIIEKSKELKKGLMQKLFSEGIGHTEFKDTKIGRIPKDWEVKKLKEVGKVITSGISFDKFESNRTDKGVKVLFTKVSDMNLPGNERVLKSSVNEGLFKREFVDSNSIVEPESLIFPKRGAAIKTNKKRICGENIVLDPNLIAVSLDSDKANYLFVYYFIMTFDLMRIVEDGTIPQLNKRDIEPFKIPLPSLPEQNKIAEILSEADKKIEKEEQYKFELEQLKKGLMQQLLTGQKRVKV